MRLNSRMRAMICQPSRPGSGDVEDHEVGMVLVEAPQGVGTGPGDDRPIAGPAHPQLDEVGEVGLVLDDEDRLSHGRPRRRTGVSRSARLGPPLRRASPGQPPGRRPVGSAVLTTAA